MDKIDQIFRMQQLGFAFYAMRDVYMAHLDKDVHAPPIQLDATRGRGHAGRLICDISSDEELMASWEVEPKTNPGNQDDVTFLGKMRILQWLHGRGRLFDAKPEDPYEQTLTEWATLPLPYQGQAQYGNVTQAWARGGGPCPVQ
jgi:hypothetical protein